MAGTLTVKAFFRQVVESPGAGGGPGEMAPAEFLTVLVDRFSNGAVVTTIDLPFADYAGLEAEFDAGSATTVLDAAIEAAIGTQDVDMGTLTSTQRSYVGTQIAIA